MTKIVIERGVFYEKKKNHLFQVAAVIILAAVFLNSCEDILTPQLEEDIQYAELPEYKLTIVNPTGGTATPVGEVSAKDGELISVSVTPDSGFVFTNWIQTDGSGTATFTDESSATTTVALSGGDATILPAITNTPRNLTVIADTGGAVSPHGTVTVSDGIGRAISATAANGYDFVDWEQTAGPGSAAFANNSNANTTVTVTAGDTEIRANFEPSEYTITVDSSAGGSVSTGSVVVLHGVQSGTITATAQTGYSFSGWEITTGSGVSFNPNSSSSSVQITATGGNATIRANFTLNTYTLNISSTTTDPGTGGYINPSGNRTVSHGVAFSINAYAYSTYTFDNWAKVSGTGTVVFGDSNSANTTVTVSGGNAGIRATFRKEDITLSELGAYQPYSGISGGSTVNPDEAVDLVLYGGYLYVLGDGGGTNAVVRQWNVSSPSSPYSGNNDYDYLGNDGNPNAMIRTGSTLFVGTDSALEARSISTFSSSVSQTSVSHSIYDLDPDSGSAFWAISPSNAIRGFFSITSSGQMYSGGAYKYILNLPGGVGVVNENNGYGDFYTFSGTLGAPFTGTADTIQLHNGGDMDMGWVGPPVTDIDSEYAIIPVEDEDSARIHLYDITNLSNIFLDGSVVLPKRANYLYTDVSGFNDSYLFAAAGDGSDGATIYVIDIYSRSTPFIAETHNISGYGGADALAADEDYIYVALTNPTSGSNQTDVTVMVLQVNKD